jgi:hypothetical protein
LVGAMKELLGAQERQVGPLGVPPDPPAVGPALENPK